MKPGALLAGGIALALLANPPLANAGGGGPVQGDGPGRDPDRWSFEFTPYLWFASLDGTIVLEPLPAVQFAAQPQEPLVNLDFALADSFIARKGPWVVLSEITYTKLGVDETVSSSEIEIDSALLWAGVAGGYAVVDAPGGRVELFAGARYMLLDNDGRAQGTVTASNSKTEDWLDPLLGFTARGQLTGRVSVELLADVGGFGVGSDLSYELLPKVTYTWNEIISLNAGYRLLDMDFESSDVEYDVREAGCLLGVAFHF